MGTAHDTNLNPLIILQKKCIRIINRADYLDHTEPLFKSTKLLKLGQIHILSCVKFIYNCYKSCTYSNFRARLIQNSQIHDHNTRIASDLRAPYERLEIGLNSFFNKGIKIWNKLPSDIKSANSIIYFKYRVKKWIFESTIIL